MAPEPLPSTAHMAPGEVMAARLMSAFTEQSYTPFDAPMLLPADVVLDRLGEDIRQRLLLVTAPDGRKMCLRPDFTIPVARAHIGAGAGAARRYAYAGLAFRFPALGEQTRASAEFFQAGVENFGDTDAPAADAETLNATIAALSQMGLGKTQLLLGDVALFSAFVETLALGPAWKKRLIGDFSRRDNTPNILAGEPFAFETAKGSELPVPDTAFALALAGMEVSAARAVVEEVMAIAGTAPVGGRTTAQIAARFVEQAQLSRDGSPGKKVIAQLNGFLDLNSTPRLAVSELKDMARLAPGMAPAVASLEARIDLAEAAGVDLDNATFSTGFAGRIEYYTGMVFEIRTAANPQLGPIASGGRYDGFLAEMGAKSLVPAVGASVYVDRLIAALAAKP